MGNLRDRRRDGEVVQTVRSVVDRHLPPLAVIHLVPEALVRKLLQREAAPQKNSRFPVLHVQPRRSTVKKPTYISGV
jgi:hypothetical protein